MPARRTIALTTTAVGVAMLMSACAGAGEGDAELGTEDNPVQLGVVGASEPYWATYESAVEDAGIAIDIVDFTDYNQPNPALSEGELDINQFQHIIFLADYNVNAGDDLVPIGSTAIYPLGLYSTQYDSVEEIPDGAEVAVPNDDTNQARGLLILQQAGLITLADGGSPFSTVADVDEAGSRVTVTALDAAITASSLPDVAAAIINNDFITDAGLTPEDAIAQDDPTDPSAFPYINIFATTADDAENEVLAQLVEIYQTTPEVQDGVLEAAGGAAVLTQTPAADLQASLEEVQAELETQ
ncbi:MetQ/NlpA family ABC transporter substrate-binding protein [Pseudactinotalea suaedae]|uniref:MetQ/NlpA family ABC transporter substrate-binding protein n=1 Tax=Pseudactinotalea suaedae TaxID=1524924 RepID=UPI0012E125D7|nr:MetQ/NlpA family ABC transporter substrate-binding protein [Pseudactinotalea suaedae]